MNAVSMVYRIHIILNEDLFIIITLKMFGPQQTFDGNCEQLLKFYPLLSSIFVHSERWQCLRIANRCCGTTGSSSSSSSRATQLLGSCLCCSHFSKNQKKKSKNSKTQHAKGALTTARCVEGRLNGGWGLGWIGGC